LKDRAVVADEPVHVTVEREVGVRAGIGPEWWNQVTGVVAMTIQIPIALLVHAGLVDSVRGVRIGVRRGGMADGHLVGRGRGRRKGHHYRQPDSDGGRGEPASNRRWPHATSSPSTWTTRTSPR